MLAVLYFLFRLVALASSATLLFFGKNLDELTKTIAGAVLIGAAASLFESVRHSWSQIQLTWKIVLLGLLGRSLRISFASLIRIKVDDHYMLLYSKRWNQFGLPGGVYRYFDDKLKQKFALTDDSTKATNTNELRLTLRGRSIWNVFRFIKWFETRKGRECDPHREFAEELINNGLVPAQLFAGLMFEYDKTVIPKIDFSSGLQNHQLFAWEIFSPVLSDLQLQALRALKNSTDARYCFLTEDEIERDGLTAAGQIKIGSHTKYIL